MLSKVRARLPDPNMIDTRGPANLHYHIHYLWYWAFCFTCRWAFPGDQRLLVLLLILLVAYGTALIWNGLSELRRGFSVARHHTDKLEGPWINSAMRKEADNQDRPPRPWTGDMGFSSNRPAGFKPDCCCSQLFFQHTDDGVISRDLFLFQLQWWMKRVPCLKGENRDEDSFARSRAERCWIEAAITKNKLFIRKVSSSFFCKFLEICCPIHQQRSKPILQQLVKRTKLFADSIVNDDWTPLYLTWKGLSVWCGSLQQTLLYMRTWVN